MNVKRTNVVSLMVRRLEKKYLATPPKLPPAVSAAMPKTA